MKKNRMNRVLELTRDHWSGRSERRGGYGGEEPDGYFDYKEAIPVLFATLTRLQDLGPQAAVWWRCGHRSWEALTDALDNPKDVRAWRRRDEARNAERKRQQALETEQRQAEVREARERARARTGRTRHPALPELRQPDLRLRHRQFFRSATGRPQLPRLPLRS
ncbi:hypothetical protein [Streptomyces sp. NPDC048489]|uniref:hypothetical protein n=1 Tax=Streptomyces sp. NPDC048489 TaxID=3154504 RepID=UPI0034128709